MKKNLFILTCLLCYASVCRAQTVAQVRCNSFHEGVNLSNWLEGYWETNWPDSGTYSMQFLAEMKRAGIKSVRMPVCFALVTDTLAPYTVDTSNRVFKIIDSVISWTAALDMNLIIDNHHEWNIYDSTWRQQLPRLGHLWSVLAQRYQYLNPDRYFFEILNEPNGISNDSLALMYPPVIDSIRQFAPFHSIVVSPQVWSEGLGYDGYLPLSDTNLIYTFHSYDPYQFSHQGLSFVSPELPTGVTYPNSGFDFLIPVMWGEMLRWRDTFQRPVFVGEFGCGIGADAQSRCNWMDTIGGLIDVNHLSAFHWDVLGDFRLYNSGVATQDSLIACFQAPLHLYGDTLTAITNIAGNIPLNIFPNPASASFTVATGLNREAVLEVDNNLGQNIFETRFTGHYIVHNNTWAKGIYFVKVRADNELRMGKVVIQ